MTERALLDDSPVHPHVHGELEGYDPATLMYFGSSPRAWGTQDSYHRVIALRRFIPTCMGNSSPPPAEEQPAAVHPHVHGELLPSEPTEPVFPGSSPRAWGTHPAREQIVQRDRFIPTCMGNSEPRPGPSSPRAVHPHVHGELAVESHRRYRDNGSSPRAWGTHDADDSTGKETRFIPTCMGNS